MKKNIGTADRVVRLILGVVLAISIVYFDLIFVRWVLFISSIFCFFQAVVGWCALYSILGKNTCPVRN